MTDKQTLKVIKNPIKKAICILAMREWRWFQKKIGVTMTNKQIKMSKTKRYCEGIDCSWCDEKEPCIYRIANELEQQLKRAEQKLEKIKEICKNVMPTGIDEETDKFGDILEIIEE